MTYEEFVRAIESNADGRSPLARVASMKPIPEHASSWLLRWVREKREEADRGGGDQ